MTLRITVSRHAAFYSPLIATIAGGFLKAEGIETAYGTLQPGQTSAGLIHAGVVDIMQSAVASNWKPMERGEHRLPVHFAQINQRDGFFLVGRKPGFTWKDLEGRTLVADHGHQPMVMLQYAAKQQGVDWSRIHLVDAGKPDEMAAAFRGGAGDYVHLQGPGPHLLEHDGTGKIVAAVGDAMPPVAFSSLCCSREFLKTPACAAFLRAFAKGKEWVRESPAAEVAQAEASFFPHIDPAVLAAAVRSYQQLGCWEGGTGIPRALYEQALNVFESAGAIAQRHAYDDVCAVPPATS